MRTRRAGRRGPRRWGRAEPREGAARLRLRPRPGLLARPPSASKVPRPSAAVRPHASSRAWAVARCSASCSAHRVSEAAIACMSCVTRRERARRVRCAAARVHTARAVARCAAPLRGRDHGHGWMRPAAGDARGPACGLRCALRVRRGGMALAGGLGRPLGARRHAHAARQSRRDRTGLCREEGLVGIPGCGVTTNELIRRLE